jgi:hypothetical protein
MNNDISYKIFNLQKYLFEIRLWNPDGDEVFLNPEAVVQLVIEDDLHFWPVRGFLIYENPFEIFERKFTDEDISNLVDKQATKKRYNFRNDGKDYLDITIRPDIDGDSEIPLKNIPPEMWEIKHNCVVYDKEDLEVKDVTQKLKKLYFWDISYQKMLDKRIQWSTATSYENPTKKQNPTTYDPSLANDDERKMFTGDAVKDILITSGFLVDYNIFDSGSTKILYTAFQDKNVWENIEYILKNHISKKTGGVKHTPEDAIDICIFSKERYSGKFQLEPVYQIFSKAGCDPSFPLEYQIEHLFFDETAGLDRPSVYKAPILEEFDSEIDVKLTKIKKYQYVDMSGGDNTKTIVTTPVHSYDFKTKTFSINMSDSNVNNLEDKIKSVYIDRKVLSKNGPHPLLTLNSDKTKNRIIEPVYSIRSDKAAITKKGLGRMLYSSLFLNNCLVFDVDGATIRKSGKFVGIDRMSFSDNLFDYKLCGQWFITKVKHVFFHNMYINEVTSIKLHSYDNLNITKYTDVEAEPSYTG